MTPYTAHTDTFARDNLPPADQWPEFRFDLPDIRYPEHLNCTAELLDNAVGAGRVDRVALYSRGLAWSYGELLAKSNQIARVLREDLGIVPGNRVLLRAPNTPMMVAAWFGVIKAGGIAVSTMPMLRACELAVIIDKACVRHAICDARLVGELESAAANSGHRVCVIPFGDGDLEGRMASKPAHFENVDTGRDDTCVLAFTSGTTGKPKATMHFHRDVMMMADIFARHILRTNANDIYCGTPPLAFNFGLGCELVAPLRFGAALALFETPTPEGLLTAIDEFRATTIFTSPTGYRAMLSLAEGRGLSSLRQCISAGEPLPKATSEKWKERTNIRIIDGIGSTEMTHIFISAPVEEVRPGATGRPLPGYRARILDGNDRPMPAGSEGRLAIKGPTGCRYLADGRQRDYVRAGWNVTGDVYVEDEDGYFWFKARADDMIVSGGYNIAGPEVESALMAHDAVAECAVVAAPDPARGSIVKAFVVPAAGRNGTEELGEEIKDFVKAAIAPYKYPRAVEFVSSLPKTETGKLQRFKLRAAADHPEGFDPFAS
jgi:2-aminobenzoate-CoA ligase